ncbi:MAG: hypothetical protein V9G19_25110 [Tetrasphaera sp.]
MSLLDALGWLGSALLVVSVMQTRILRLRVLNLIATVILLGFNAGIRVWPMVAMNAVLAGINVWFIAKLGRQSRSATGGYAVLPVREDEAYVRHFLATQAGDIARFFPGFRAHADGPRACFLIQRGEETAGLVVVRDLGEGVAQIDLDYVTPPYRDFTPGRFLWQTSDLMEQQGWREVRSPREMVAPHYARVGFRPAGDHFVLTR